MQMRRGKSAPAAVAALLALVLILASAAGCGGEGGGGEETAEPGMEELWARAEQADSAIESWHMEIASYYENTQYGSGQIQSIIIAVNGDDLHEQDLLLGQVYFEHKRVGGKQYNKDVAAGTWSEVAPDETSSADVSAYTSRFLELPALADTREYLGREAEGDGEAERFRFTLGPESVRGMFSAQPSFDFSENDGGEVEVWIDSSHYYLVRYELLIRNVIIPEKIGRGDIRFVVSIRDINQPVIITPPA